MSEPTFEEALNGASSLLHSGIPHPGNLHDAGNCVCCEVEDKVRAAHAREVAAARLAGRLEQAERSASKSRLNEINGPLALGLWLENERDRLRREVHKE